MKLAPAALLAAFAFTGLAFGVGCSAGETKMAPLTTEPAPSGNPDNSEYGDDDDTSILGARPDPKSTTPIGFPKATGDDDDDDSTSTPDGGSDNDGGAHLRGDAGTPSSSGGSSTSSSSSSSSSGGSSGGTTSSSSSSSGSSGKSSSSSSSSSGSTTSSSSSSSGSVGGASAACKATTVCGTDATTTDLGYVSGDEGADVVTASGTTSHFFKVVVGEDSLSDLDLYMTATLTSPPGANYDLFVYTDSCAKPSKYSISSTGTDVAWITIPDTIGSDDQYVVVEVRAVDSTCSSTDKWSLKVEGNK